MTRDSQKILLVDDDEIFLKVLSRAFQKRNYHVLPATNIAQALAVVEKFMPEYAVIDLKIGKESGLECVEKLKAINPDISMLILTGYSSIATAVRAIKLGAIDYACKPLDADEILSILTQKNHQRKESVKLVAIAEEPVSIRRLQWEHIQRVFEDNKGNVSATARSLGMHRRTLQRKLQKKPVKR